MATHAGKEGTVLQSANVVAEIREWSFTQNAETADNSAMGDSDRTHLFTLGSWDGSITCWWDETDTAQQNLTRGASISIDLRPEGSTGGDVKYTGTCTITSILRRAALDGIVEVEFSFLGSGALTAGTV